MRTHWHAFVRTIEYTHAETGLGITLITRFGRVVGVHLEGDNSWSCLTGAEIKFWIKGLHDAHAG